MGFVKMNKLEKATRAYWNVSHALRHPRGLPMTVYKALMLLRECYDLGPKRKVAKSADFLRQTIIVGESADKKPIEKPLGTKL